MEKHDERPQPYAHKGGETELQLLHKTQLAQLNISVKTTRNKK